MTTNRANGIKPEDLHGVFSVPPLPRTASSKRGIDFDAAERVASHIAAGGITRFLYGGNAFLYHVSLAEYEALLDWLADFPATRWAIPSVGPSFGRALDQACLLRRHALPDCAMLLPCGDPRDARRHGSWAFARSRDAAGIPLIIYLKSEDAFGTRPTSGTRCHRTAHERRRRLSRSNTRSSATIRRAMRISTGC